MALRFSVFCSLSRWAIQLAISRRLPVGRCRSFAVHRFLFITGLLFTNHLRDLPDEVHKKLQKNQGSSPIGKKSPACWNTRVANFDPTATSFKSGNALLLAQLCNAAYLDQAPAQKATEQLGLPGFIWIDLTEHFTDLYAIAAGGPGFVVIAFRGTKDFDDWMTDLKATPVSFPWIFTSGPDVGDIHAGFGHSLVDAWDQIKRAIGDLIPTPDVAPNIPQQPTLWLTGHSLGGALAVLTAAAFSMWSDAPIRSVNGVYTFGQPRVGLFRFCGNYDHLLSTKTFRFVNNQDLVPRVPFRGFDYADVGQIIHFDSGGNPKLQEQPMEQFPESHSAKLRRVLQHRWPCPERCPGSQHGRLSESGRLETTRPPGAV